MSPFLVRWIKFSLVTVVGCGFLAMAIYAFVKRDEIRSAQIEPPLIEAPQDALKRRPDQPGGMEIPNRDKLVFDLLDSDSTVTGPVNPLSLTTENGSQLSDEQLAVLGNEPVSGSQVMEAIAEPAAAPAVAPAQPVAPVVPVAVAVEPKPVQPVAAAVEPKPEPKVEPVKAAGGSWGVQLGAVGSKSGADAAVAKLAKNSALKGLNSRVVATPDGKNYRIQFVGVKDRAAASAICAKLGKAQACFPIQAK